MPDRKKNTSKYQLSMFLDTMEKDSILRLSNKQGCRYEDFRFPAKWKQFCKKLNTCTTGPHLNPEEWYRRLSQWKHGIRRKYRHNMSGKKTIKLTALEKRGLQLLGTTPSFGPYSKASKKDGVVAELKPVHDFELETQLQHAFDEIIAVKEVDNQNNVETEFISGEDAHGANNNERESVALPNPGAAEQFNAPTPDQHINEAVAASSTDIEPHNIEDIPSSHGSLSILREPEQHAVETKSFNNQPSRLMLQIAAQQFKRIADINLAKLRFEIAKEKFINKDFEFILKAQ